MVMLSCTAATPNESAMRGAAVETMVPSRFSMKNAPATSRARPRQGGGLGTGTVCLGDDPDRRTSHESGDVLDHMGIGRPELRLGHVAQVRGEQGTLHGAQWVVGR